MPLETRIDGDPGTVRDTVDWLHSQAEGIRRTGDQIFGSRGDSESGWRDQAGEHFRQSGTELGKTSDTSEDALRKTSQILQTYGDDLASVQKMMADARDIARKGGLTVSGTVIQEPGPAPGPVPAMPADRPCTQDDVQTQDAARQAQDAFQAKAKAYNEASDIVIDARGKHAEKQSALVRLLSSTLDPVKGSLTALSTGSGVIAQSAEKTSAFHEAAEEAGDKAARWSKLANSPNMSLSQQTHATAHMLENQTAAERANTKAMASRTARVVDRMPAWAKQTASGKLGKQAVNVKSTNSALKGASKFGSKLSKVGGIAAAAGVGYDIYEGKDPTKAVVSGGTSFVAGEVVGTAIGGPVGALVGGAVGVGVGWAVDEIWDAVSG